MLEYRRIVGQPPALSENVEMLTSHARKMPVDISNSRKSSCSVKPQRVLHLLLHSNLSLRLLNHNYVLWSTKRNALSSDSSIPCNYYIGRSMVRIATLDVVETSHARQGFLPNLNFNKIGFRFAHFERSWLEPIQRERKPARYKLSNNTRCRSARFSRWIKPNILSRSSLAVLVIGQSEVMGTNGAWDVIHWHTAFERKAVTQNSFQSSRHPFRLDEAPKSSILRTKMYNVDLQYDRITNT
jgi:hypothetical protein